MYTSFQQRVGGTGQTYERIEENRKVVPSTESTYQSAMSPRVTYTGRRPLAFANSGTTRVLKTSQAFSGANFGQGLASLANGSGIPIRSASNAYIVNRQRDKHDLEILNDKFAIYIERVRYLEVENRRLLLEIEALKNRLGQGSSRIKDMYLVEMDAAQKLIEKTKKARDDASIAAEVAEEKVKGQRLRYNSITGLRENDRKQMDDMERQISENDAQINLFRRRIADLEDEARRYKAHQQRLASEVSRLSNDLQSERIQKSSFDVEKYVLEEEIASIKAQHEIDLANLRDQAAAATKSGSDAYSEGLVDAIREVRADFEASVNNHRARLMNNCSVEYNELAILQQQPDQNPLLNEHQRQQRERLISDLMKTKNQNNHLEANNADIRNRMDDLRRKLRLLDDNGKISASKMEKELAEAAQRLAKINRQYDEVSNLKTSLEKEISTYRELLDSASGLRPYVERIVQNVERRALDVPVARSLGDSVTTTVRTSYVTTGSTNSPIVQPGNSYASISSGFRSGLRNSTD